MKSIFTFLCIIIASFISTQANLNWDSESNTEVHIQEIDFELLYQTWYIQEMLMKGTVIQDMSTSGEFLRFNRDKTVLVSERKSKEDIIKDFEITAPDQLSISYQDQTTHFVVKKLTATELELMIKEDPDDFSMRFKVKK